jgi:uncharacterized protein (TIGR01777 family)
MRIVIPGGTGLLGRLLAGRFHTAGWDVTVLSRTLRPAPWRVERWDPDDHRTTSRLIAGADVLINLAGRSVNCRYTTANRREILASRVRSTETIGAAIAAAAQPPRLWLQASTATIYSHRYDAPNSESQGLIGCDAPGASPDWRWSVEVARAWEAALDAAETPHTRKIALRTAIVMSTTHGGAFDILLRLVRWGLGGPAGDGRQFVSWIHEEDFLRAVEWLISVDRLSGPVNLAAPAPLPNADFMRGLRAGWGVRLGLPAPRWMLAAGAVLLGTETELVLKSRRVTPARLLASGFVFQYPDWPAAAHELCQRWRVARGWRSSCESPQPNARNT